MDSVDQCISHFKNNVFFLSQLKEYPQLFVNTAPKTLPLHLFSILFIAITCSSDRKGEPLQKHHNRAELTGFCSAISGCGKTGQNERIGVQLRPQILAVVERWP